MKNLIYPDSCVVCDKCLDKGFICDDCDFEFKIKFIKPKNALDGLYYLADLNSDLRRILHLGKYRFNKEVWKWFGSKIKQSVDPAGFVVTYVSMNWMRYCYRGFNQSEILAKEFCAGFRKIVYKKQLFKNVTNLNKKARFAAIKNSFSCREQNFQTPILIVDDVYTTGATLNEIALTIKKSASQIKVYGLVIAKTPIHKLC